MEEHTVEYSLIFENGWTYGNYRAVSVSANPSECAHMIMLRRGSAEIVGVRIQAIDGQRCSFVYERER